MREGNPLTLRRRAVSPRAVLLSGDLHPVLRRVYLQRGIADAVDLDLSLERLPDPDGLAGCSTAAARLATAVEGRERIVVVGDYDADGATSSALAMVALRQFGAREPSFLVPNRFTNGYGLTPEVVAETLRLQPDLLVTVDNGISSHAGVAAARARGIDVLVTDHHLPGAVLPEATAVVNPQCGPATFPARELAGVGVIFYLMMALRRELRERGWFARRGGNEPNLGALLDLVAVGTVADMVRLDRVNRTLVAHGLRRIRDGQARAGIQALLEVSGRDHAHLGAADLGFSVAPRINAAGRLADMGLGVRCLLEEDLPAALALARELDGLNRARRDIEQAMREQAEEMLALLPLGSDGELPAGVCLYDSSWHQGVVGILAGRVKERVHRPVVAFAPAGDGWLRGSARSLHGIHLRDALQALDDAEPGLIERFGGHAMAAGLTLRAAAFARFAAAFAAQIARQADPALLQATLETDGPLQAAELVLDTARALEAGGPWGQGFPEPLFDGAFGIVRRRVVGEQHLQLVVRSDPDAEPVDAIAFRAADNPHARVGSDAVLAYRTAVNRYRGTSRLQLVIEHLGKL